MCKLRQHAIKSHEMDENVSDYIITLKTFKFYQNYMYLKEMDTNKTRFFSLI